MMDERLYGPRYGGLLALLVVLMVVSALFPLAACTTVPKGAIYPCETAPISALECYDKYGRLLGNQKHKWIGNP
jgi:hypothetical protein